MALAHKKTASVFYAAGLVIVYLGQRVVEPGPVATLAVLLGLGVIAVALVLAIRQGQGRPAGRILPALHGLGLFALALHFARASVPALLGHRALSTSMPKLDGVLAALWPAVLFASILPTLFVEFSLARMARSPVIDGRRVRAALLSGLGIAFALVFCIAGAYVASERDLRADLSFFRTARASAATKQLVAALDQPVEVTLFYPPANEVAEEMASYFADLARASSKLTVSRLDQAVDPVKAKALNVTSNGVVTLARGNVREQLAIPLKLESARPKLRVLDQDVHKRLLSVSRGKRTVYQVTGHEEHASSARRPDDAESSISRLKELLQAQNLDVRELGLAQGLGNDVPADAGLVLVMGPQQPMLREETDALARYFQRGGRLLIAVDPEARAAVAPLLARFSLEISGTPLTNDRMYWARTHQKADRTSIPAANYSSHAALATVAQFGTQRPLVLLRAGALSKGETPPAPAPTVEFIIRSDATTWDDKNENLDFDGDSEQRKPYPVAAAVTTPKPQGPSTNGHAEEGRAFVLGDSDAFCDLAIMNTANAVLALDVARWLLGEPEAASPINNEEDVPVRHTRKQDVFWFYSSVFLAPSLVLFLGWVATRRRRHREVKP